MRIDLHTHTFFSDGELLPSELLRRAVVKGYTAIGITDHADSSNLEELLARLRNFAVHQTGDFEIELLIGVELTHLPPGRIDKSALTIGEPKRLRDKAHLKFVASQPCLICGRQPADPHHLRFAQPRAIGMKVSDEFTVPLCAIHHSENHSTGDERRWWQEHKIDPLVVAAQLWISDVEGGSAPRF